VKLEESSAQVRLSLVFLRGSQVRSQWGSTVLHAEDLCP